MVHLVSVQGEFEARLIMARLGTEGIVTELRAGLGSPYPMMGGDIYVGEADLDPAREVLSAGGQEAAEAGGAEQRPTAWEVNRSAAMFALAFLAAMLLVVAVLYAVT